MERMFNLLDITEVTMCQKKDGSFVNFGFTADTDDVLFSFSEDEIIDFLEKYYHKKIDKE